MLKKLLCHAPSHTDNKCVNLGLLILRLFAGITMGYAHGMGKIPPPEQLVQGVSGLGFPMPEVFAWLAALAECGGFLIALGLFTRSASFFLAFTMAIAGFMAHAADPFNVKEMAFLYLSISVMFMLTGPGAYSLDAFCKNKFCKKS